MCKVRAALLRHQPDRPVLDTEHLHLLFGNLPRALPVILSGADGCTLSAWRSSVVPLSIGLADPGCGPSLYASGVCRSKSHRRTSRGVAVLVDQATEDAGAEHTAGVEVVRDGGALAWASSEAA